MSIDLSIGWFNIYTSWIKVNRCVVQKKKKKNFGVEWKIQRVVQMIFIVQTVDWEMEQMKRDGENFGGPLLMVQLFLVILGWFYFYFIIV